MGMTAVMTSDVCIVGGAGHVGLPLALVLADKGQRVCIFDTNTRVLDMLERGVLPHMEQDAQPYLDRALSAGRLRFSSDAAAMGQADTVIVTTQKDMVKLCLTELGGKPAFALRIGLNFRDGEAAFAERLRRLMTSNTTESQSSE